MAKDLKKWNDIKKRPFLFAFLTLFLLHIAIQIVGSPELPLPRFLEPPPLIPPVEGEQQPFFSHYSKIAVIELVDYCLLLVAVVGVARSLYVRLMRKRPNAGG